MSNLRQKPALMDWRKSSIWDRRMFFRWAAALMVGMCVVQTNAHAATISSISTLPLSDSTYIVTGNSIDNEGTAKFYQKPSGLVVDALAGPTTGPATWRGTSGRHVRTTRNNAQSFNIDAVDYPYGVDVTAFVMQFLKRGDTTNTFGIELFSVADAQAATIPETVTNLLSGVSALSLPTATSLGVAVPNTVGTHDYAASGTAIFNLDEPLLLAPGAYVWRFVPSWSVGNSAGTPATMFFDWGNGGVSYDGGRRYEENGGGSFDFLFGVVGTATVPEPSGMILAAIGLASVGFLRFRRKK